MTSCHTFSVRVIHFLYVVYGKRFNECIKNSYPKFALTKTFDIIVKSFDFFILPKMNKNLYIKLNVS